jgi:nitroreductase
MNEVLKNIYDRRSVRSYTEESVPEELVREIIKAGFHAPNGHNEQGLRFAVITNKARLKKCSDLSIALSTEYFEKANAEKPSETFASLLKILAKPGLDVFYGAPVLVLVFAGPQCLTPMEDGSLAAENMMLAAHSFGLGSCWIGFAKPLMFDPEFMKSINVPMDHQLIAPLIFGYPKKADSRPSTRAEPPILAWLR